MWGAAAALRVDAAGWGGARVRALARATMAQGDAYVLEGDRMLFGIDAGASGASSRAPIGGAAKGAPPAPAAAAAAAAKYERAAATGNVAAMVRLAALALRARPEARGDDAGDALPPRNLRAARKWLERAAESGSADAHLALGKMFEESPEADASTPAPHEDAGARSAKDAAGGGDAAGWEPTVGETPAAARDHAAAAKHYGKAADAGLVDAKAALGYLYETGLGVRQNAARAVQLYREAAEKGHAKAQNNLGSMYFQGSGGLTQDPAKAVEWYRRAARGGSGSAANNLGICYEDGIGVDADPTKAEELYARAAAAGNMHAQNNIAYMKVANRDYAAAELWFRRAAEQGSHDALHNLGGMAEHGLGMPVSLELAVHLYDRASAGGSEASAAAAEGAKAAMEARTGEMAAAEANIAELARAREDLKAAQASIVTLEAAAARGAAANAQAAADKAALEAQVTDLKQLNDTFRSLSRNHSMKSNGSDGSSGMGANGSMQMLTTGSAQGQSLRPMGGHAKVRSRGLRACLRAHVSAKAIARANDMCGRRLSRARADIDACADTTVHMPTPMLYFGCTRTCRASKSSLSRRTAVGETSCSGLSIL